MSHNEEHDHEHGHQHEQEQENEEFLGEEDVIEVHEDDGDEPMDDDDDNAQYDGEIVIGAPMPGEEEEMELMQEDNSLGASCTLWSSSCVVTFSVQSRKGREE